MIDIKRDEIISSIQENIKKESYNPSEIKFNVTENHRINDYYSEEKASQYYEWIENAVYANLYYNLQPKNKVNAFLRKVVIKLFAPIVVPVLRDAICKEIDRQNHVNLAVSDEIGIMLLHMKEQDAKIKALQKHLL